MGTRRDAAECEEAGGKTFVVTIRLLSGEPIAGLGELRVCADEKVDVLMTALAGVSGTERWQLFFEGYELRADEPFAKYGMADDATVNALLTWKGGIEQAVRRLLTTICVDNLPTIIEQLVLINLNNASELQVVISFIWEKMLCDPCNCEAYADMLLALRTRHPAFPPEKEHEKPQTFLRILINVCQDFFESIPMWHATTDEEKEKIEVEKLSIAQQKEMTAKEKERCVMIVKFIGQLFVRRMLAEKVVGQVVYELIVGPRADFPDEHFIECTCELLLITVSHLDNTHNGKILLNQFFKRLADLMKPVGPDRKCAYSESIQSQIQGLKDFRSVNWADKNKGRKGSDDNKGIKGEDCTGLGRGGKGKGKW